MTINQHRGDITDKPDFKVEAERLVTSSGSELVLGYVVKDVLGRQVAPKPEEIFLSASIAHQECAKLMGKVHRVNVEDAHTCNGECARLEDSLDVLGGRPVDPND